MKLHLPFGLRKALLACLAALAAHTLPLTMASGASLAASGALVSFFLSQESYAAFDESEWEDADVIHWSGHKWGAEDNPDDAFTNDQGWSWWLQNSEDNVQGGKVIFDVDPALRFYTPGGKPELTIRADLWLRSDMTITNGASGTTWNFEGSIVGDGNINWRWNNTFAFVFKGNMEDWTGDITNTTSNNFSLTFEGVNAVTGSGNITTSGALTINGATMNNTSISARTLTLSGTSTLSVGSFTVSGATSVSENADIRITQGTYALNGTVTMAQNSALTLQGGAVLNFAGGTSTLNTGSLTLERGSSIVVSGGSLTLAEGLNLSINGDSSSLVSIAVLSGGQLTLDASFLTGFTPETLSIKLELSADDFVDGKDLSSFLSITGANADTAAALLALLENDHLGRGWEFVLSEDGTLVLNESDTGSLELVWDAGSDDNTWNRSSHNWRWEGNRGVAFDHMDHVTFSAVSGGSVNIDEEGVRVGNMTVTVGNWTFEGGDLSVFGTLAVSGGGATFNGGSVLLISTAMSSADDLAVVRTVVGTESSTATLTASTSARKAFGRVVVNEGSEFVVASTEGWTEGYSASGWGSVWTLVTGEGAVVYDGLDMTFSSENSGWNEQNFRFRTILYNTLANINGEARDGVFSSGLGEGNLGKLILRNGTDLTCFGTAFIQFLKSAKEIVVEEGSSFSMGVSDELDGTGHTLSLSGSGKDGKGALYTLSGATIGWDVAVADSAEALIKANNGLTFNGSISGQNAKLTIDASAGVSINSTIGGENFTLSFNGVGGDRRLTLGDNARFTGNGKIELTSGNILLSDSAAASLGNYDIVLGKGATYLHLTNGTELTVRSLQGSETNASVQGGSSGSGTYSIKIDYSGTEAAVYAGKLGAPSNTNTVARWVQVTKAGTGTQRFTGEQSKLRGLIVEAGTLDLAAGGLVNGALTLHGGATLGLGGTLNLTNATVALANVESADAIISINVAKFSGSTAVFRLGSSLPTGFGEGLSLQLSEHLAAGESLQLFSGLTLTEEQCSSLLSLVDATGLSARLQYALSESGVLSVGILAANGDLTWKGGEEGAWVTNGRNKGWQDTDGDTFFTTSDGVLFTADEELAAATVSIEDGVQAGSITIEGGDWAWKQQGAFSTGALEVQSGSLSISEAESEEELTSSTTIGGNISLGTEGEATASLAIAADSISLSGVSSITGTTLPGDDEDDAELKSAASFTGSSISLGSSAITIGAVGQGVDVTFDGAITGGAGLTIASGSGVTIKGAAGTTNSAGVITVSAGAELVLDGMNGWNVDGTGTSGNANALDQNNKIQGSGGGTVVLKDWLPNTDQIATLFVRYFNATHGLSELALRGDTMIELTNYPQKLNNRFTNFSTITVESGSTLKYTTGSPFNAATTISLAGTGYDGNGALWVNGVLTLNGTLSLAANATINAKANLTLNGTLTGNGHEIIVNLDGEGVTLTLSGNLTSSSSGTIHKYGNGLMVFNYTDGTALENYNFVVEEGGRWRIDAGNEYKIRSLSGSAGFVRQNGDNRGATLVFTLGKGEEATYSGQIGNRLALKMVGAGKQVLAMGGTDYVGGTVTVEAGTLEFSGAAALVDVNANGGTLVLSNTGASVTGTLTVNGGTLDIADGVASLGTLHLVNSSQNTDGVEGTLEFAQSVGFTNVQVDDGKTLLLSGSGKEWTVSGALVAADTAGALTVDAGTLTLSAGGGFGGTLTLKNGAELKLGADLDVTAATLSLAGGAPIASTNTTTRYLVYSAGGSMANFTGISFDHVGIKVTGNDVALGAGNTVNTTVWVATGGLLDVDGVTDSAITGAVTVDGTLKLRNAAELELGEAISGTGTLQVWKSQLELAAGGSIGTVEIGWGTAAGDTALSLGANLALEHLTFTGNASSAAASISSTAEAGVQLVFSAEDASIWSNAGYEKLDFDGVSILVEEGGTLKLWANGTLAADVTLTGGTLDMNNTGAADNLAGISGTLTVDGGALVLKDGVEFGTLHLVDAAEGTLSITNAITIGTAKVDAEKTLSFENTGDAASITNALTAEEVAGGLSVAGGSLELTAGGAMGGLLTVSNGGELSLGADLTLGTGLSLAGESSFTSADGEAHDLIFTGESSLSAAVSGASFDNISLRVSGEGSVLSLEVAYPDTATIGTEVKVDADATLSLADLADVTVTGGVNGEGAVQVGSWAILSLGADSEVGSLSLQDGSVELSEGVSFTTHRLSGSGEFSSVNLEQGASEARFVIDLSAEDEATYGNYGEGQFSVGGVTLEKKGTGTQRFTNFSASGADVLVSEGALQADGAGFSVEGGQLIVAAAQGSTAGFNVNVYAWQAQGLNITLGGNGSIKWLFPQGEDEQADESSFGTLTVAGTGNVLDPGAQPSYHREAHFATLTSSGAAELSVGNLVGRNDVVYQEVGFDQVQNFHGTVTGNSGVASARSRVSIGHVHQDAGFAAVFDIAGETGLYSADFRKTGEGSLAITHLTVGPAATGNTGLLYMDYEGTLSVDRLSVQGEVALVYTTGAADHLLHVGAADVLGSTEGSRTLLLDVTAVGDARLREGICLGLTGADGWEDTDALKSLFALAGFDDSASDWHLDWRDDVLWLTVEQLVAADSAWDPRWGSGALESPDWADMPQVTSTETSLLLLSQTQYGGQARLMEGSGNAQANVFGSMTYNMSYAEGATWILMEGGRYHMLAGGSFCARAEGSDPATALGGYNGASHIELLGGTVDYIVGGNHQNNSAISHVGNSYISVFDDAVVQGSIIGGSTLTGSYSSSEVYASQGDSNIFIYTALTNAAETPGIMLFSYNEENSMVVSYGAAFTAVVGGNAQVADSAAGKQNRFLGEAYLTIDLSSYDAAAGSEFQKAIVGGDYIATAGSAGKDTFEGSSQLSITGVDANGAAITFTAGISGASRSVAGGQLDFTGSTSVSLAGGEYSAPVAGGFWLEGAATATLGSASAVSLSADAKADLVVGGSYVAAAGAVAEQSGASSVSISNATVTGLVVGGSYLSGGSATSAGTGATLGSGAVLGATGGISAVAGHALTAGATAGAVTGATQLRVEEGATVGGHLVGGSYAAAAVAGELSSTGTVSLELAGGSINGNVYGGHYADNAAASLSLSEATLRVEGTASIRGNIFGGSHGAAAQQGSISVQLVSGSLSGNVYAAGESVGSGSATAETTVEVGSGFSFAPGAVVSGGYLRSGSGDASTVSRSVLKLAESSSNLSGITWRDFSEIEVSAAGENITLDSVEIGYGTQAAGSAGTLRKTGAGDLTLTRLTQDGSAAFAGQLWVAGGSLRLAAQQSLNGGLGFTLAAGSNTAETAYLQGLAGFSHTAAGLISLGLEPAQAELSRGRYYLASGLESLLGSAALDEKALAGIFDLGEGSSYAALKQAAGEYDLSLQLQDGVLLLMVRMGQGTDEWYWEGDSAGEDMVWRGDSTDNWNQDDMEPNAVPHVHFDDAGLQGTVRIGSGVTVGDLWVHGGSYTFAELTGEYEQANGLEVQGKLIVGEDAAAADLALELATKWVNQVELRKGGRLVLNHAKAIQEGQTGIHFAGGTLIWGETAGELAYKGGLDAKLTTVANGAALNVQVGKTYGELLAERTAPIATRSISSGVTLGDASSTLELREYDGEMVSNALQAALQEGVRKLGRFDFTVEWAAPTGTVYTGFAEAQGGTLEYRLHGRAGQVYSFSTDSAFKVSTGATLAFSLEDAGTLDISRSFEHVRSTEAESWFASQGTEAEARVIIGSATGNLAADGSAPYILSADNSGYNGVIQLQGSSSREMKDRVLVADARALGGAATTLELAGRDIAFGPAVAAAESGYVEVSVKELRALAGSATFIGGFFASRDANGAVALSAERISGAGEIANAKGGFHHTLTGDMSDFAGTIVAAAAATTGDADSSDWTLLGDAPSTGELKAGLAGTGTIILNFEQQNGLLLTGAIGGDEQQGNSVSVENAVAGATITLAGAENTSTGSLIFHANTIQLGDKAHVANWAGSSLVEAEAAATATAAGSRFVLANGTLDAALTEQGKGAVALVVDAVGTVNVNGTDGALLDDIVINRGGKLREVSGAITAGSAEEGGVRVRLVFDELNMSDTTAPTGENALIGMQNGGKLVVKSSGRESGLQLDFSGEGLMSILKKHRAEDYTTYLHLLTGGTLSFDPGVESENVLRAFTGSGYGRLLADLGFITVGHTAGDLILAGSSTDVYLVLNEWKGEADAKSRSHSVSDYGILAGYKATALDAGTTLTLTLGAMPATFATTLSPDDADYARHAAAFAADAAAGGMVVNNLVGLAGATLVAERAAGVKGAVKVVLNNQRITELTDGDNLLTQPGVDHLDPPAPSSDDLLGQDTQFKGTIIGKAGVDFEKTGAGTLTVGDEETAQGGVQLQGDMIISGGGLHITGSRESSARSVIFADATGGKGLSVTDGVLLTLGSLAEQGGTGRVTLEQGSEIRLTGKSELEHTTISSADSAGVITLTEDSELTMRSGDSLMENVQLVVESDGSALLEDGATIRNSDISVAEGGAITATGGGSGITGTSDVQLEGTLTATHGALLNTTGSLALSESGVFDIGNSIGHSVGHFEGSGTLTGSGPGTLTVHGKGNLFTGTLTGIGRETAGALVLADEAELTLRDVHTDAEINLWDMMAGRSSKLIVDALKSAADMNFGDIVLGDGSELDYTIGTEKSTRMHATIALEDTANATFTIHADGAPVGSEKGLYIGNIVYDGDIADLGRRLRFQLLGNTFLHFDGTPVIENGYLRVKLTRSAFNKFATPDMSKNPRAGADLFWAATDPDSTAYAYMNKNPKGDLALFAADLTAAMQNGQRLDKALAAGAGSAVSVLGSAATEDIRRQLESVRNRASMLTADLTEARGRIGTHVWMNGETAYHKMDADGYAPGFTLNGWGGSAGVDLELNREVNVGLAITAMYNDLKSSAADSATGDLDTAYLTAFARVAKGSWTHTIIATIGTQDATLNRTVQSPLGYTYTTHGSTDGFALGAMYEIGYGYLMNKRGTIAVQPVANVQLRHISLSGYTESGSDAGLRVDGISQTVASVGMGARVQAMVAENAFNRAAIIEARVLAKVDAGDRSGSAVTHLQHSADAAEVESAQMGAVGVEIGAGVTVPISRTGGSVFVDAAAEFRSGYSSASAGAGYRVSF